MLARSPLANHAALRYLSYAIDTTLLTAALMLVTILHQYPFVQAWLTVKVLLLVVYVVLGSLALKRATTRRAQVGCFFAAMARCSCSSRAWRARIIRSALYTPFTARALFAGSRPALI